MHAVYSTCLYCARDLGTNDTLETLPVGRRIAFDAAQGRLWVVCRRCAKWNLVPFETRLETIDAAERLFRDTPTRYSTEHIGLAKVREGLELVRIGRSERREFAAWRYGRRGLSWSTVTPLSVGVTQLLTGGMIFSAIATGGEPALWAVGASAALSLTSTGGLLWSQMRRVATVRGIDGKPYPLRYLEFGWTKYVLDTNGGWSIQGKVGAMRTPDLDSPVPTIPFEVRGAEAVGLMQRLLGDGPVAAPQSAKDRDGAIALLGGTTVERAVAQPDSLFPRWYTGKRPVSLWSLPPQVRLALLMATHEQREREWMEGELALLEREWRDADRLAKISDGMALDAVTNGRE